MKVIKLCLGDFRLFNRAEVLIGKRVTAIAGNNGTGKSTVLGILANSSQITNKKTLLGKSYKGEFSELFSADKNHDPSGQKVYMWYEENGTQLQASFRTAWQKYKSRTTEEEQNQSTERFRVIPKRKRPDGTETESKIPSPVIYLGLSRLYPVGETVDGLTAKSRKWADADDESWFNKNYSKILSIHEPIKSLSSLSISGITSKSGTGVETDTYGPTANSSGQDNLGQILLSILSLRKLKKEMGSEWDGGLLLIDEVDASLHPAAQLRLLKLLEDESKANDFQVVFTTHSTVLLKEMSRKNQYNPTDSPGNIEVSYFSCANGSLEVIRNPSWSTIENGLLVSNPALRSKLVGVFSEDDEARWLMKGILNELCPDILNCCDFLGVTIGCDQIISLYTGDFCYFRDRVVVFDGDVEIEKVEKRIPAALRKSGGNIVVLPGGVRPENVIWDYLSQEPTDENQLWKDLDNVGVSWMSLVETPPQEMYPKKPERERYKEWLKTYISYFDRARVIKHWVDDNPDDARAFARNFIDAYNNIAGRIGAPIQSMAKSEEEQ